jgi:PHS family inorganic phosphate transporter-like MFS transporter
MQGFGILAQGIVAIITIAAFETAIKQDINNLDYVWRICLGMGAVPGMFALYSRITIPESPRFTIEIDGDIERAAIDVDIVKGGKVPESDVLRVGENRMTFRELISYMCKRKNFFVFMGTCLPRFALNVAFYGINLNSGIILQAIGFSSGSDVYTTLLHSAIGQVVIALLGSIPGYL